MIASNRINIFESDKLVMDLEYTEHYAILHLPMLVMSKSTYLAFREKVEDLHKFLTTVGYEAVWTAVRKEDTTVHKLLGKIGAKALGEHDGLVVYEYRGAA